MSCPTCVYNFVYMYTYVCIYIYICTDTLPLGKLTDQFWLYPPFVNIFRKGFRVCLPHLRWFSLEYIHSNNPWKRDIKSYASFHYNWSPPLWRLILEGSSRIQNPNGYSKCLPFESAIYYGYTSNLPVGSTIWLFNIAMTNPRTESWFLAGKIIYFYGPSIPWLC